MVQLHLELLIAVLETLTTPLHSYNEQVDCVVSCIAAVVSAVAAAAVTHTRIHITNENKSIYKAHVDFI